MLAHLSIQNYALISSLDLSLSEGFSVLTGETGAGKSIILGALSLLMGGRADARSITEGEQKCVIEGEFDIRGYGLEPFFESEGLDYSDLCSIRRELTAAGKSRSFVNDTPVTLQVLKPLGARLIDIHSQHQNLLLSEASFCLSIVDSLAGNAKQRAAYGDVFSSYVAICQSIKQLEQEASKASEETDFIHFRHEKLVSAHLQEGEMEELEEARQRLAHAEDIRAGLTTAMQALQPEDADGALTLLRAAHTALQAVADYLPVEEELPQRIQSARIELDDILSTLDHQLSMVDADPARLALIEERQAELYTLFRQFGVDSVEALIAERERLGASLDRSNNYAFELEALQKEQKKRLQQLTAAAAELTASRKAIQVKLEQTLTASLSRLGIAHAAVQLQITPLPQFAASGADEVALLFAANKNQALRPVNDIASGGEMARLMLSIKALIADTQGLPTIIFDEVDTGVSGEVAGEMGRMMRDMAHGRQVLAITHLPQIAALGEQHFQVYKQDTDLRTESHIRCLSSEERITEIAHLLSGTTLTQEALSNAKRLLQE